jgi:choline dehydrogenase-like flavoprotein
MLHPKRKWPLIVAGLTISLLLASSPAAADPRRITQGDAQAIFEAFGTGGRVIVANGTTTQAAPADFFGSHGSIRPFDQWDGQHFCAEDWHVILIAGAAFDDGDPPLQSARRRSHPGPDHAELHARRRATGHRADRD